MLMGKIESLTKEINKLHMNIEELDDKIELAKDKVADGELSKGDFYKIKQDIQMKDRDIRAGIHRKEKARLFYERKQKDKEKETGERGELRQRRAEIAEYRGEIRKEAAKQRKEEKRRET